MERSSRNFLAFLKQKKIPDNICFSEQIFKENSRWVPLFKATESKELAPLSYSEQLWVISEQLCVRRCLILTIVMLTTDDFDFLLVPRFTLVI